MKPTRIGYFGGTFDPPHRGHLAVARAARAFFQLDRVLLAPTGRQPLKPNGPEAAWADRYRMTELLCAGEPGLKASSIDSPRQDGTPNYTADTLRRLQTLLFNDPDAVPDADSSEGAPRIYAILGADAFLGMSKWREPETLLQLADWIVVSRPGIPVSEMGEASPGDASPASRVHRLDGVNDPVSATEVRQRLHAGESCEGLIPGAVLDYIRVNGLYER